MSFRRWSWLLLIAGLSACAREPSELGPDEALRAFLVSIERSAYDPAARKSAYTWIDERSKKALVERAELTASLAGQALKPWELLVPGRVSFAGIGRADLRMRVKKDGERASVEIPMEDRESVAVPMRQEGGVWHVVLGLVDTANAPESDSDGS